MELVRHILLEVEAADPSKGGWVKVTLGEYPRDVVGAHIGLLGQAGLLEVDDVRSHDDPNGWMPKRLTWQGHEFLDAIRNDDVWKKTKERAATLGGQTSFELVKAIAIQIAKSMLGLP